MTTSTRHPEGQTVGHTSVGDPSVSPMMGGLSAGKIRATEKSFALTLPFDLTGVRSAGAVSARIPEPLKEPHSGVIHVDLTGRVAAS